MNRTFTNPTSLLLNSLSCLLTTVMLVALPSLGVAQTFAGGGTTGNSNSTVVHPPTVSCSGNDKITWTNSNPTAGHYRMMRNNRTSFRLPVTIPAAVNNGAVQVNITDAVAYDGYGNRRLTGNQPNERFRVIFRKNGVTQWASPWTGRSGDDGLSTGTESAWWRGALGGSTLSNGFDEIYIAHWSDANLGTGDISNHNSVEPTGICIEYTPIGCNCAGNLVQNPSFENGTSSWSATGGSFYTNTYAPQCGNNHSELRVTSSYAHFSQTVASGTIVPGSALALTVYAGTHNTSFYHEVGIFYYNSSWGLISKDIDHINGPLPNMRLYTINSTVPAGTHYVVVGGGGDGDYIKTDQWCLKVVGTPSGGARNYNYSCSAAVQVDCYGQGTINVSNPSVTIPNLATVDSLFVVGIFKNGTAPASVTYTTNNGQSKTVAARTIPNFGNTCSNCRAYVTTLNPASQVNISSLPSAQRLQGFVVYAFRSGTGTNSAFTGVIDPSYIYRGSRSVSLPISTTSSTRTIKVKVPVMEMTNDSRIIKVTANAGGVSATATENTYDPALGKSYNIVEVTLNNVPGSASSVAVTVESPSSGSPSGDSYIITGVSASGDNCCPANVPNAGTISGNQENCGPFNPANIVGTNLGTGVTYRWQYRNGTAGNWVTISNATAKDYNPGSISQTRQYRRQARKDACNPWKTSSPITKTVNPFPSASAGPDKAICSGGSVAIAASASGGTSPYTYSWNQGLGAGANKTVSPTATTNYTVTVTDAKGCTDTDVMKVTVNANPTANAGADKTICSGSSTTLSATSSGGSTPYTYTWNNGLGTGTSKTVSPTSTTNYTVTVRDGNNCTDTDVVRVNVINNVTNPGTISANQSSCGSFDPANITGTAATGGSGSTILYQWQFRNGTSGGWANISGATNASYNPTTITTTRQYRRLARRGTQCPWQASNIVTKTVNGGPSVNAGADKQICAGASTTITASGSNGSTPYSYSWNQGLGAGASKTVSPTTTTTYTVTLTDANGCNATDQVKVTVNPNPTANAGADKTICSGSSTTITASASAGTSPYSYSWNQNLGAGNSKTVSPTSTTTYTVTVTDSKGCTDTDAVRVNVITNVTNPGTIAANQSSCGGFNPATITGTAASGGAGTAVTYQWQSRTGTSGTFASIAGATGVNYNPPAITATTQYRRLSRRGTQCPWRISNVVTMTVNGGPSVNAGNDVTICSGQSTTLTATGTNGSTPYTYSWNQGLGTGRTKSVSPTATTTYTVTLTDGNGCTATDQVRVTVNPKPNANAGPDVEICLGQSTTLGASATSGTTPYTFTWNQGLGTGANKTVTPSATTNYTVTVRDARGCTDTDVVRVTVNPKPNANAGPDQTICAGESTTITATATSGTPAYTYSWNQGLGTGATKTVSPTNSTNYTVTVTDAKGCTDTDVVRVNTEARGSLGDYVFEDRNYNGIQDATDPAVSGVTVRLFEDNDGNGVPDAGGLVATTTSNANGLYSFPSVCPGDYVILFGTKSGYQRTIRNNTAGKDAADSDANPANGRTGTITLAPGENDPTNDAGYYRPASLGDFVFEDLDADGVQDAGEPGIQGVTVTLLDGSGQPTGQTTTTNASGAYSFTNLTPGNYIVQFTKPSGFTASPVNTGGDDTKDSDASVTNGRTAVINLTSGETDNSNDAGFYQSTARLGDLVFEDKNANGIQDVGEPGIAGVTVRLLRGNGTATGQTTTTNGSGIYAFTNLAPGSYIVEFVRPSGYQPSPVNQGANDALDSDANATTGRTGVRNLTTGQNDPTNDAGFYVPASLGDLVFEDLDADGVQDANEPGIAGVTVTLLTGAGQPTGQSTTTNGNGNYSFTNLTPGDYIVEFSAPSGYTASPSDQGGDDAKDSDASVSNGRTAVVDLESGENDPTVDAGFFQSTARLGNFVWEDKNANGIQEAGEPGIQGVTVRLLNGNGSPTGSTTTTNANGIYNFTNLAPGTYRVEFVAPNGFIASPANQGGNDATDSDANTTNGRTGIRTIVTGQNDPTNDAGFYRPVSLGDLVFEDRDADGVQDAGEPGISGVTVVLLDGNGNTTGQTTTTNGSGAYSFTGLTPGDYIVDFVTPNGYSPSPANQGGDDTKDSDAAPSNGQTNIINLESGENDITNDAGYFLSNASLGDFVFEDKNADGIQDAGDTPIQGVRVNLLDGNGQATGRSTTTNSAGFYQFANLAPGSYIVEFVSPNGYLPSPVNQGADDAKDSDASTTTGRTGVRTLVQGQNDPTNDAGFYRPATLGDFVFEDLNANGIQDNNEPGIPGVTVRLLDGNGSPTGQTASTNNNGGYTFTGLTPGDYIVEFVKPNGYSNAPANQGGDDTKDSDANPTTGRTGVITLESAENNPTNDAGFFRANASLGDYVFEDKNANGIQDGNDSPIQGVTVRLRNGSGQLISGKTTTTDANGLYQFTNLAPGTYIVEFVKPAGYEPSPRNQGGDDTKDSDANVNNGRTGVRTLVQGQNDPSNDAGFYRNASLGDVVFEDRNGDGIQDAGEPGIPNVTVTLLDGNGNPTGQTTTTNASGVYSF
ncbi:MAG: SdrD B-like domain-containing protein, partial [Bacteroidia bacterium]